MRETLHFFPLLQCGSSMGCREYLLHHRAPPPPSPQPPPPPAPHPPALMFSLLFFTLFITPSSLSLFLCSFLNMFPWGATIFGCWAQLWSCDGLSGASWNLLCPALGSPGLSSKSHPHTPTASTLLFILKRSQGVTSSVTKRRVAAPSRAVVVFCRYLTPPAESLGHCRA